MKGVGTTENTAHPIPSTYPVFPSTFRCTSGPSFCCTMPVVGVPPLGKFQLQIACVPIKAPYFTLIIAGFRWASGNPSIILATIYSAARLYGSAAVESAVPRTLSSDPGSGAPAPASRQTSPGFRPKVGPRAGWAQFDAVSVGVAVVTSR